MLENLSFKKIERNLRYVKSAKYPPCVSTEDLIRLLTNDGDIRNEFGRYRSEDFYQAQVSSGDERAVIFVIEQLASKVPPNCFLAADGTFGITPLKFKQLLIIMAEIEGKVSVFL